MKKTDTTGFAERKKSLRGECFARVRELSDAEKAAASARICRQLKALPEFQAADTVFAYLPLASEPDLTSLFDHTKSWGFARVLSGEVMEFRQMADLADAMEGVFKIREPEPEKCPLLRPESADLVIVPGVGFCPETGNRLGRGKGHYDRYLEKVLKRENPPKLIGVCFAVQICEVESEAHDITMDLIISG